MTPNVTAWDDLYKRECQGTGRNMFICVPQIFGKFPDRYTWQTMCRNYTPDLISDHRQRNEFGFVYNEEKPFVDICIGIATVVTTFGIPGKTCNVVLKAL